MKAKENINYRASIGKPADNYFKMVYNLSFETESDTEILADMTMQDMIDYLLNNYGKPQDFDKQVILNDLIIFKSHKEELEMNLKRKEIATNIFSSIIAVIAAVFAVIFAAVKNTPCWFIGFAVVMLISSSIVLSLCHKNFNKKESEINKLKTVNNIIYILEEIKNERINRDKNFYIDVFNGSEKLKDTSSVKVNADDKNSSENEKNKNKKNKNKNKKR